jgi:Tol biopolymer transport system component
MFGEAARPGRLRTFIVSLAAAAAAARAAPAGAVQVEPTTAGAPSAGARNAAAKLADSLPAAVARSQAARVDSQILVPTLAAAGGHLSALGTLGNPTIAIDPAGGFALDTPKGNVTLAPAAVAPGALPAALVNGDSALFAGIQSNVSALLRPTAAGIATVLQIESQAAPELFAFSVDAPRGETVRTLDDGTVAVLAGDSQTTQPADAPPAATGIDDTAALTDPALQYGEAREAARSADAETTGELLAVIQPPQAEDATGQPVPVRLETDGDAVTIAVDHQVPGLQYPLVVMTAAAAPDSWRRPWRDAPGTGPSQPGPDGLFKVLLDDGEVLLTHGQDLKEDLPTGTDPGLFDPELENGGTGREDAVEAPEGHTDGVEAPLPSTIAGDVGLPPVPGGDPVCASAGKKRVQVMHSGPRALDDPARALLTRRIRRIVKAMNVKLYSAALESGSENTPRRFKVACEPSGRLAVRHLETTDSTFEEVVSAAKRAGATDGNTKYLIFEEGANDFACGEANMYVDDRASARNINNGRRGVAESGAGNDVTEGDLQYEGGYAIVYGNPDGENACWNVDTALHENGHTMGAVQDNAPEANGNGHCDDGFDVMCQDDREEEDIADGAPLTYREDVCAPAANGWRYDCNYDTYFDAGPESGEYLASKWNIGTQENLFLNFAQPARVDETFVFSGGDDRTLTGGIWRETDDGKEDPHLIASNQECDGCIAPHDPALSPDSQTVVFLGQSSSNMCYDLRLMEVDGGSKDSLWRCADHPNEFAARPAFSPSGRTIIYDDAADVWTMSLYGTELKRVVDWGQLQYQPSYSPDGASILFTSEGTPDGTRFPPDPVSADRSAIYRTDRDGSNPVKLTDHGEFARMSAATFSPDGTQIAFEGVRAGAHDSNVYVMNADGSNALRLSEGFGRQPGWTPGGEVAYSGQGSDGSFDLFAVNPDGTGRRALVSRLSYAVEPAFRQPSPLFFP